MKQLKYITVSCLHPLAVVHDIGLWVGTVATDLFQGLQVGLEWVHSLLDQWTVTPQSSVSIYSATSW